MSDEVERIRKEFGGILEHVREEDYWRCAAAASRFLKDNRDVREALPYFPMAAYLRLFAEGYRTWQTCYRYTEIRNKFRLALMTYRREADKAQGSVSEEDAALLSASFEHLSEMLCAYTRCENAIIGNDPFALRRHAEEAIGQGDRALDLLHHACPANRGIADAADWLRNYFQKNRCLHRGFLSCAEIYSRLMAGEVLSQADYRVYMDQAEEDLQSLTGEYCSPELASELNAHIRHLEKHWARR